jgi:hypothetical protein
MNDSILPSNKSTYLRKTKNGKEVTVFSDRDYRPCVIDGFHPLLAYMDDDKTGFKKLLYWICQKSDGTYWKMTNRTLKSLFKKQYDNAFHFGVGYIKEESASYKLYKHSYLYDSLSIESYKKFLNRNLEEQKDGITIPFKLLSVEEKQEDVSLNFDNNMKFFNSLSFEKYDLAFNKLVLKYGFKPVSNMKHFSTKNVHLPHGA